MLDWEKTHADVMRSSVNRAVMPVGACESHGFHLPLGTDSFVTSKVAAAVAETLDAYLLPLLPFGTSSQHIKFRGTVTLRHSTLAAMLEDIVESLHRTGFKTLVIVSLHGGNYILHSDFLKVLQSRYQGMRLIYCDIKEAWREALKTSGVETKDWHAGEVETSILLALRPELVKKAAGDFPLTSDSLAGIGVDHTGFPYDVSDASPTGVLGCPSKASREKGELFLSKLLEMVTAHMKAL